MVERIIESDVSEVPEMDDTLVHLLTFVLADAKQRKEQGETPIPFTAVAVAGNLFYETFPSKDPDESEAAARRAVENVRGADAYAFCYDGFVNVDDVEVSAIIAEGGVPGEPRGFAIGHMYRGGDDDGTPAEFDGEAFYVGPAPNFMMNLTELDPDLDLDDDGITSAADGTGSANPITPIDPEDPADV